MSILSANLYGATTGKGATGLLSGLDTDALVEQMSASTKAKINKQYQSKQKLIYQQEAYRGMSKKMIDFKDKYFSFASGSNTNILSSSFFKSNTIESSSDYINVTGNTDNIKNFTIDSITSIASKAKFTSDKPVSSGVIESKEITDLTSSVFRNTSEYFTFDYNGIKKNINMTADLDDASEVASYLQGELNSAYGDGKVTVGFNGVSNKFEFLASGTNNTFEITSLSNGLNTLTGISSGTSNRLNTSKKLSEAGLTGLTVQDSYTIDVNGSNIDVTKDMTVSDIIKKINDNEKAGVTVYYSSTTNTFTVEADETGSHKGVSITDESGNLASTLFGTEGVNYNVKDGKDTQLTYSLNDVPNTITRSTASFTVDEVSVELSSRAKDITEPVTFEVKSNNEEIINKVKDFVKNYNDLLSSLTTAVSERPDRKYQPITPDQKEEMDEKEIEDWDAQAKKGILFGDNILSGTSRKLRSTMTSISSNGLTLSIIGIESAPLDTSGKLVVDEEKLSKALSENANNIQGMFTGINGISSKINTILKDNVGAYGTAGALIDRAGMENSLTSDSNSISKSIKGYDDLISRLQEDMEDEKSRNYTKFASLESALARLNSQASMFTQAQQ